MCIYIYIYIYIKSSLSKGLLDSAASKDSRSQVRLPQALQPQPDIRESKIPALTSSPASLDRAGAPDCKHPQLHLSKASVTPDPHVRAKFQSQTHAFTSPSARNYRNEASRPGVLGSEPPDQGFFNFLLCFIINKIKNIKKKTEGFLKGLLV